MTDITDDVLLTRRDGPIAVLTMNIPQKKNVFSLKMREELYAQFYRLMFDQPEVRAIVLTGAGGAFCAGGDISEMKQRTLLQQRARMGLPTSVVRLMVTGPKPVVAAVEGHAYGAGLSLAAACDYVVAADNAKFCCAFVRIGLMPDTGILWTLAQKVGPGKARELITLATEFDGAEAGRIGLANRVVEPGKALEAAMEVAYKYAGLPPVSLALIKAVLATGSDTLEAALKSEIDFQGMLSRTTDHVEAVKAFMEKRKPVFTGE